MGSPHLPVVLSCQQRELQITIILPTWDSRFQQCNLKSLTDWSFLDL